MAGSACGDPPGVTVVARTGIAGLTIISANVAINREGLIAFAGNTAAGSQVFVTSPPTYSLTPLGFAPASGRTYAGVGISSGPNPVVLARELVSGPAYVVRSWSVSGNLGTIIGSSVTSSGPKDFDSASFSLDMDSNGVCVVPALVNGSTATQLMIGATRPLSVATTYGSAIGLRPQIADTGEAVIRDNLGRIILFNAAGPTFIAASSSSGFAADTGNRPGISTDGAAIAFSGNRGAGAGVYVMLRLPGYPSTLINVAGGELADGFSSFASEQRIGVRVRHSTNYQRISVVFQASRDGVNGIYTRDFIVLDGLPGTPLPANRLLRTGDSLASSTVTAFTLYRPFHDGNAMAFSATLADGGTAIVTAQAPSLSLRTPDDTADVSPLIEPSILRVSLRGSVGSHPAIQIRRKKIRVNLSGPPSTDLKVYLTPDSSQRSGHDHWLPGTNRPHGWLALADTAGFPPNVGQPNFEAGGTLKFSSYDDATSLTVTTDGSGEAHFYYTAPEICGVELINASTIHADPASRLVASVPVTVKADLASPFLPLQPAQSPAELELTGVTSEHSDSHYGTAELNTAILRLARNYSVERLRGTVPNFPLPVNDMSLIHGGLFDIDGDWSVEGNKGHKGHRVGIEVDMGGMNSGHGLVPKAFKAFDRMWEEQGCFGMAKEGDHYHFILNGTGRPAIAFPFGPLATWQNEASRLLAVSIPFENAGGADATQMTITSLQTTHGTLQTSLPITAGPVPIRSVGIANPSVNVLVIVPPGVKGFFLTGGGSAASVGSGSTPVPSISRGKRFVCFVKVPPLSSPASPLPIPPPSNGDWGVTVSNPNQPAVAGSTVVYSGTIRNDTGTDLYLSSTDLNFIVDAPRNSYEFDLAQQLLATGGVIPTTGYTGPLFIVTWLLPPPLNSFGSGALAIVVETSAGLSTQSVDFASSYKPQTLSIETSGPHLIISWSLEASEMVLESSTELTDESEWLPVAAPVVQSNGKNTVTLAFDGTRRFFRLNSDE